jgi:tRNA dimethylallyltransferase
MAKLLVICGPTATGKTSLALRLAEKFGGEIVSADSRQVYRGMDIGTGKDISPNAKWQMPDAKFGRDVGFYEDKGIKIWGYDLVGPLEEFSVAHYLGFAQKIIDGILRRKMLPVLVGGTGLYIKAVADGIQTANYPRNQTLRRSLEGKSPKILFELLASLDPLRSDSMNISDRKNPRRLIRAIEVAQHKFKDDVSINKVRALDLLFIGLTAPKEFLNKRIEQRVKERLKKGFENEVWILLQKGISFNHQSMQSLGYRQWKDLLLGKSKRDEVIREWIKNEYNYAKRQMTWFKKDKRIVWFDISKKDYAKNIEKLVQEWYSRK